MEVEEFLKEAAVMKEIKHPNLVYTYALSFGLIRFIDGDKTEANSQSAPCPSH